MKLMLAVNERLYEQRRIVAYLDSVHARLASHKGMISLRRLQSATGEELRQRRTLLQSAEGATIGRGVQGRVTSKTLEVFMTKGGFHSLAAPLVVIPLGGLLMMALTLVVYGILFNLLESLFFPNDPLSFPAGPFRMAFAVVLVLLYLLLLRTQLSDRLKAILLTAPLSTIIITVGHALYEQPSLSVSAMIVVTVLCGLLLHRFKKAWIYYYAGAIASLVALVYAWPRL